MERFYEEFCAVSLRLVDSARFFFFSFFLSCCGISEEEEEEALWSRELLLKVGWLDLFGFGWELLCLGWCGCLFMGDQERVLAQLIKIW